MGYKRLFDDTDFQELPLKQARQLDFSNRSTQFAENLPYMSSTKNPDSSVNQDNTNGKPLWYEVSENAVVPKNCTDEDVSFKIAACSSLSPQYPKYKGSWECTPFSNAYIPYFDRFPRKQVPLGQNHQASIPPLCPNVEKHKKGSEESSEPNAMLMSCSDEEKKLMGTCILPMPDTKSFFLDQVGLSGSHCCCLDAGSFRCVQQHVSEARDKLKKSLGHENFSSLGFTNMGEEVAWKWTENEERLLHAVIYSNPPSSGQNFWNHLTQVFPARPMDEIVSYYFNVFMLRKRASQNRSDALDIDSDDDELHGIDIGSYEGEEDSEEDDSGVESPVEDYSRRLNRGEDIVTEDDDDDDDDDDGDGNGNGDMQNCCYDDFTGDENSGGVDYISEGAPCGKKSFSGNMYDNGFKHAPEKYDDDHTAVQDDSCTSFEFQADKDNPCYHLIEEGEAAALHGSGVEDVYANNCSSGGEVDACSYMMDVVPMLDFRNDVLGRLYSSPGKCRTENVSEDYMVQDHSCLPSEAVGVAVEGGGVENGVATGKVNTGCSDAMDLIPMLDFRDEKAWDAIFPGSV
ncbi:unnamed protein product [Linum tenue]|uniref:Myb-like domain-containing protein n=1 Tax=Linum tenue TaxID=586396 RepID=A0AAV0NWY1_9ROSI|nr:unnamed protein product [Linum tenue]